MAPNVATESCAALAKYLTKGGTSHDDLYDPTRDTLTVYGHRGREFLITAEDTACITGSTLISKRVRDAVQTYEQNLGRPSNSELLESALRKW